MILGVNIRNFDVFEDDTIGLLIEDSGKYVGKSREDNGIRLRNLNALIGRNNTGKSAFIRALSFVKRSLVTDVAKASTTDNRPGFMNLLIDKNKPCEFRIFFRIRDQKTGHSEFLQYELTIGASEYGSPFIECEKVLSSVKNEDGSLFIKEVYENSSEARLISDEKVTALSVLGKLNGSESEIRQVFEEIDGWFFCAFSAEESSDYYSAGNAPGAHKHLNSDGSNVGNVLDYIKSLGDGEYESLMNEINSKIPALRKKKKNLPLNLQGSPEKLFKYLLLLRDPHPKTTIFIETPDRDLYHDMVDVLADDMREFTLNHPYSQIIFSTHNPYIVEAMSPKEIWVFSRDFEGNDDAVRIRCAGSDPVVMALFEQGVGMGAIWYGGHLDQGSSEYDEDGVNNAH